MWEISPVCIHHFVSQVSKHSTAYPPSVAMALYPQFSHGHLLSPPLFVLIGGVVDRIRCPEDRPNKWQQLFSAWDHCRDTAIHWAPGLKRLNGNTIPFAFNYFPLIKSQRLPNPKDGSRTKRQNNDWRPTKLAAGLKGRWCVHWRVSAVT